MNELTWVVCGGTAWPLPARLFFLQQRLYYGIATRADALAAMCIVDAYCELLGHNEAYRSRIISKLTERGRGKKIPRLTPINQLRKTQAAKHQ